jgi:hypothetical protein
VIRTSSQFSGSKCSNRHKYSSSVKESTIADTFVFDRRFDIVARSDKVRLIRYAFYDLVAANQNKVDIGAYLHPIDALIIDANWWNAVPNYAPVSSWYLEGSLHLKGFVLPNTSLTLFNFELFVASKQERIISHFIGKQTVIKFIQTEKGDATFTVLSCPRSVDFSSLTTPFYKMSFAYMSEPQAMAPQIVLLGIRGDDDLPNGIAARWDCTLRDSIRGSLMDVPRDELKNAGSTDYRSPMTFYQNRDEALRAAGRGLLAPASLYPPAHATSAPLRSDGDVP